MVAAPVSKLLSQPVEPMPVETITPLDDCASLSSDTELQVLAKASLRSGNCPKWSETAVRIFPKCVSDFAQSASGSGDGKPRWRRQSYALQNWFKYFAP